MKSLDELIYGRVTDSPLRIGIYGTGGVGKTTWAAGAPEPVIICTEDGARMIDAPKTPVARSWDELRSMFRAIGTAQHGFRTAVIDSMDWAEALAEKSVCTDHGVESIEKIPYGKGWVFLHDKFCSLLRWCDNLSAMGMHVIAISHSEVRRYDDPEGGSYDRHGLKLNRRNAAKLAEWVDFNLFANFDTTTTTEGEGLRKRVVGRSYGQRLLYTSRTAAYDAKTRVPMPAALPLEWAAFWDAYQKGVNQ